MEGNRLEEHMLSEGFRPPLRPLHQSERAPACTTSFWVGCIVSVGLSKQPLWGRGVDTLIDEDYARGRGRAAYQAKKEFVHNIKDR